MRFTITQASARPRATDVLVAAELADGVPRYRRLVAEEHELSVAARAAHDAACAEGRAGYLDPDSGLFVMTEDYLRRRSTCCGTGCRHCPWSTPSGR